MGWPDRKHPEGFVTSSEENRAARQYLFHTCKECPFCFWNLHHLSDELICLHRLAKTSRSSSLFIDWKVFCLELPKQKIEGWTDFFQRTTSVSFENVHVAVHMMSGRNFLPPKEKMPSSRYTLIFLLGSQGRKGQSNMFKSRSENLVWSNCR